MKNNPWRYCPRDEAGFCRIALLGGPCLADDTQDGSRCPKDEEHAHWLLVQAAKRAAKRDPTGERASG